MVQTAKSKPRRRTQAERRATTQNALMEATIECLVEYGYSDTTTARIAERAGVSRGAQVHHYPTKAALVAAAQSYIARRRSNQLKAEAKRLPEGRERITAALDLLWRFNTGPLPEASLELWVAARTDPELRKALVPVEREVIEQTIEYSRALFGKYAEKPGFDGKLLVALAAVQGYALISTLLSSSKRDRTASWRRRRDELAKLF